MNKKLRESEKVLKWTGSQRKSKDYIPGEGLRDGDGEEGQILDLVWNLIIGNP